MARIRTIKPEFFTSEDIVALSPLARLLYIALWCEADREGRLNWKPRTLKMKYLPAESCDVMTICDELVSATLVVPYSVGDEPYAVLPSFKKHQAINVREAQSNVPAPPDAVHVHARAKDAWLVDADTRVTVLARDAHKCVRCSADDHLQIDHIFPKSMGGTNAITNLRVLCRSCNAGRPVSGQGLIDDLAKDGLTLNDMQRTCMHVQGDGEGKGREGKGKERKDNNTSASACAERDDLPGLPVEQQNRFDRFWTAYPKKRSKGDAVKAWVKIKPSELLVVRMLTALTTAKTSDDWKRDAGQYIPHPASWLNAMGWEDEPASAEVRNDLIDFDPLVAASARKFGEAA